MYDELDMKNVHLSVTDSERRRLQDAFRRLGGGGGSGGTVGKSVFVSDVLGAGFPAGLAGMDGIVQICHQYVSFCKVSILHAHSYEQMTRPTCRLEAKI